MIEIETRDILDSGDIRVAQAEQLKKKILSSCVFVETIIFYIASMLLLGGFQFFAVLWLSIASGMVAITFAYSKLSAREGINTSNVDRFLTGHVIISSFTGIVWGVLAIYFLDWDSAFSLFVVSVIVCTVIVSGMMQGATYRPGFIGMATCMLIPFGIYVLLFADGPFRLAGFGVVLLYVFGVISSLHAQRNSNDGIFARRLQALNSQIREQNDVIRQVNLEKTRFLAATSHDFSQPLHAQGYFIQALDKELKTKDQRDLLKKIETSWKHQKRLLQGLVEINQLDSGTIVPKIKTVDLKKVLSPLIDDTDILAADQKIEFVVDVDNAKASTDPLLLVRIVQNILSNAFRYTQEDGKVSLRVGRDNDLITIEVQDTGPGIPKDQQAKIFEEYVQLKDRPRDGDQIGLGLGLSIVKRLTDLLEIDLSLKSELGEGSTFSLTLPVSHEPINDDVIAQPSQKLEGGSRLVVLVDDDKTILQSMSVLLSGWGYEVLSASTPGSALKRLGETKKDPALFIVDKRLGDGQSGIDLIRDLREEVNVETPAILMSGDLKTRKSDIQLKQFHFLAKPIEPENIRQIMAELITASD